MYIRKAILGVASALVFASQAAASDLAVAPYTNGPTYERETQTYEHRSAPPVVVEEAAPVAAETVIVRIEAEVAVILDADGLNARNLYVAATRGAKQLVICSRNAVLKPSW
jgi:hypothetical protein